MREFLVVVGFIQQDQGDKVGSGLGGDRGDSGRAALAMGYKSSEWLQMLEMGF